MAQPDGASPPTWPDDPVPLALDTAPVPEYGTGSLADLLPDARRRPGRTGPRRSASPSSTPADRNCVFLIDGLGWEQIKAHPDEAPFLTSLLATSRGGTGRPDHRRLPRHHRHLAGLRRHRPAARRARPARLHRAQPGHRRADEPAALEAVDRPARLAAVPHRLPARRRGGRAHRARCPSPTFEHTPLTKIALSGGTFHGRLTGEERMDLAAEQLAAGGPLAGLHVLQRARRQGPPLRRRLRRLARPADVRRPARAAPRRATPAPLRPVRHRRPRHDRHPLRRAVAHRLRRGLGAARRCRPARRRGPGPPRLRGARRRRPTCSPSGARCSASSSGWRAATRPSQRAGSAPRVDERVHGRIGDVVAAARDDVVITASRQRAATSRRWSACTAP